MSFNEPITPIISNFLQEGQQSFDVVRHQSKDCSVEYATSREPLFLTAKQCAVRYQISLRQFQTLVKRGDLPQPITIGSSKRWPIRVLEYFESEQINQMSIRGAEKIRAYTSRSLRSRF
jgi:predicted DNA-binding transcriptional regulator AlpA